MKLIILIIFHICCKNITSEHILMFCQYRNWPGTLFTYCLKLKPTNSFSVIFHLNCCIVYEYKTSHRSLTPMSVNIWRIFLLQLSPPKLSPQLLSLKITSFLNPVITTRRHFWFLSFLQPSLKLLSLWKHFRCVFKDFFFFVFVAFT